MLDAGIDAVTITTPPQTRRDLVLEAIEAGVPVIADKPCAPSAAAGRELAAAAKAKGVPVAVFHNRRFDADILTLRRVLQSGEIGKLWRVHSRMDLNNPEMLEAGPMGGLLRDLGSHLIDQMFWLSGPAVSVQGHLDRRPARGTDGRELRSRHPPCERGRVTLVGQQAEPSRGALVPNATFHNGEKFTSADVKYTFDRILNPKTASSYAGLYAQIISVDATDPTVPPQIRVRPLSDQPRHQRRDREP